MTAGSGEGQGQEMEPQVWSQIRVAGEGGTTAGDRLTEAQVPWLPQ